MIVMSEVEACVIGVQRETVVNVTSLFDERGDKSCFIEMLHYCGIILSVIIRETPYYRGLNGSLHIIDSLSLYFRMFVKGLLSLTIVFFNNVLLRVYT